MNCVTPPGRFAQIRTQFLAVQQKVGALGRFFPFEQRCQRNGPSWGVEMVVHTAGAFLFQTPFFFVLASVLLLI